MSEIDTEPTASTESLDVGTVAALEASTTEYITMPRDMLERTLNQWREERDAWQREAMRLQAALTEGRSYTRARGVLRIAVLEGLLRQCLAALVAASPEYRNDGLIAAVKAELGVKA